MSCELTFIGKFNGPNKVGIEMRDGSVEKKSVTVKNVLIVVGRWIDNGFRIRPSDEYSIELTI